MTEPRRVLLTGANGFVGTHILSLFLEKSIFVQAVVRSEAKAQKVGNDFPDYDSSKLGFSIVPDMIASGAFDQCLKDTPNLDAIIHAASPFNFKEAKTASDFIDPAVRGTIEALESAVKYAHGLKRFVYTSSFAAIRNFLEPEKNGRVYSAEDWNPVTEEQASSNLRLAYLASKTFAERAAWDFVRTHKPGFELVVLNPPLVFGPLRHSIQSLDEVNTSNGVIWGLINMQKDAPMPADSLHSSVDVRDLAFAHLQAAFAPRVGNRRYLTTPGSCSNQEICDILRKELPELDDRLPLGQPEHHALPDGTFQVDNKTSTEVLGLSYRSFATTMVDTAKSLLEVEKRLSGKA